MMKKLVRVWDWITMRRAWFGIMLWIVGTNALTDTVFWYFGLHLKIKGWDVLNLGIGMLNGLGWAILFQTFIGRHLEVRAPRRSFGLYLWPRHWYKSGVAEEVRGLEFDRVHDWCEKHKRPYIVWRNTHRTPHDPAMRQIGIHWKYSQEIWYGFETEDDMIHCRLST
jgi:hypothetical protein